MRGVTCVVFFVLAACDGGGGSARCEVGGDEQTYLISELTFARRSSGVVPGFDLDGLDSERGDDGSCGHTDLVDPFGNPGVDNNFSALVPVLEATEASATESLIAQAIASGELMLTLTFGSLDTWMGDDCVDLTLGRAEGVPLVAPDGVVLEDQTIAAHSSIEPVHTFADSSERRVTGGGLAFNLPMDVLNAELDFEVTRGTFSVQKRHDGAITGVMGGTIPIRQITEILERDDVMLSSFVPIVENTADVMSEDGACDQLSLGFELVAVPVFLSE